MKLLAVLPLLLLVMAFATQVLATRAHAATTCRNSPAVTDKCSVVSGSLGLTDGVGVTLNTDDGKRILIKAPPDSNADIPRTVMQNWLYWQSKTGRMDTRIKGRYQICPLPTQVNKAGIADFACINSASHLTADKSAQSATN